MSSTNLHTLSEICSLVTDGTHDSPSLQSTGVPFIKGKHINSGRVDFDNCDFISEQDHEKCIRRVKPEKNDVLVANIGASIGDCARVEVDIDFSIKNVALLRPDPKKIDATYFFHLVKSSSFQGRLRNQRLGAAQPYISLEAFRALKVPVVIGRAIQSKIGSIASSYDDLIENNRRRIALLEQAARLLYREWFIHLRFPGHEHVKITNGLPEGWEHCLVGDLADIIRGKSYSSAELVEADGQPFINLKCIERFGGFRISGLKGFKGAHKEQHLAGPGSIMIAVTDMTREAMIVAQAARIPKSVGENAIFSMDLVKAVPKDGIEPEWLYGMLRFSRFSAEVREEATGATVLHLKPKAIENWVATLPSAMLRGLFAEQVAEIADQTDNLLVQNQKLAQARDLLLPRLMNGEIAV